MAPPVSAGKRSQPVLAVKTALRCRPSIAPIATSGKLRHGLTYNRSTRPSPRAEEALFPRGLSGTGDTEVGRKTIPSYRRIRLDAALIVNSYHEITAYDVMLHHVRDALKPGGTFVLVEGIWDSRETQSRDKQIKHHQLAPDLQSRK